MQQPDLLRFDQVAPGTAAANDVGLARQFMAADLVTRADGWERGVRSVLLQNDQVAIEVVIDRAMDIAGARIRQLPIAWRSPTAIVAPWYVENTGFGPHRGFFGGLLTTCGLDHIGAPSERSAAPFGYPPRQTDSFPMHGRASGSPAQLSAYGVRSEGGKLEAFVEGDVVQVAVFGEHLVLRRRISIEYGSARITVADTVTNQGYASSALAVLYHVNLGWPVVSPAAVLQPPGGGALDTPIGIRVPARDQSERVRMFEATPRDGGRMVLASLVNSHVSASTAAGAAVEWDASAMPTMVQWDIANIAGNYAVALEPSTLMRTPGEGGLTYPRLEPGQSQALGVTIELLHGPAGSDFTQGLQP